VEVDLAGVEPHQLADDAILGRGRLALGDERRRPGGADRVVEVQAGHLAEQAEPLAQVLGPDPGHARVAEHLVEPLDGDVGGGLGDHDGPPAGRRARRSGDQTSWSSPWPERPSIVQSARLIHANMPGVDWLASDALMWALACSSRPRASTAVISTWSGWPRRRPMTRRVPDARSAFSPSRTR